MGLTRRFLAALALLVVPAAALAQAQAPIEPGAAWAPAGGGSLVTWLLEAIIFGAAGIAVLIGAYYLWEIITPYSVKDQLIKEKNVAVGIVVAAFIIGTAIVIAAAITPA
ncbi:MAG: DUF350 domain-containing protein [Deltaproteobacteria bacterium]|nr:DUF350 domain-containing protein [Deltaproteobacteria bacterium]